MSRRSDRQVVSSAQLFNVTLTNANEEYSQALGAGARSISIQARTAVDVRLACATGAVGTATPVGPYLTVKSGGSHNSNGALVAQSPTVFLASGTAGTIIEIEVWREI